MSRMMTDAVMSCAKGSPMRVLAPALFLLALTPLALAQDTKSATMYVDRIQCPVCAATVKKALTAVPGVKSVNVDVEKKIVVVQFDATKTNGAELSEASRKRGFAAELRKVEP